MKKHFSAGAILLNSAKQIYLIHELQRDIWALPKGTLEEGEDSLSAAVREVKEETGYRDIEVITEEPFAINKYVTKHHRTGQPLDKTVYLFIFKTTSEKQVKTKEMENEGLGGAWFTIDNALEKITHDEQKKAIQKARKILSL